MHILYYITSHGYGHAVRSAMICNCLGELSPDIRLTVCSDVPKRFFEEELTLPFDIRSGGFDVGCLQSDGVTVLAEETLRAYSGIAGNNKLRLDDEARWCRDNGVDCIAGDITPFAFDAAERAGAPSAAISNFTWHDIYSPYVERFPRYAPMLSDMAEQYAKASAALALYPALPMPVFNNKKSIPVVGRRGRNRKDEIFRMFGIDNAKRLGLIYTGNFGLDRADWGRLENFRGWEFVGAYPLSGNPRNFHLVTKEQFRCQDLSASADAVIGKMGYGVFSESLLNGVPLIYLPREDFAEFPVLDAEARRLGIGGCIGAETFCGMGWADALEGIAVNNNMEPVNSDGARICAEEIINICRNGS